MPAAPVQHAGAAVALLRGALPAALCAQWLALLEQGREPGPPVSRPLAALAAPDAAAVLQALQRSPVAAHVEAVLGPAPPCNLDQSWVRHGRPPHGWHQDGALRFDFIAQAGRPLRDDDLLRMLTCWIALTPCGADAPGLEWVDAPQPRLLRPAELQPEAVAARHDAALFRRPVLQPGDALVFDGRVLHRTHWAPAMTRARTSIELRFFARPLAERVAGDRLAVWTGRENGGPLEAGSGPS